MQKIARNKIFVYDTKALTFLKYQIESLSDIRLFLYSLSCDTINLKQNKKKKEELI